MNILVTGSEGLIGSALCRALEKQKINVIRFDKKFFPSHQFFGDILNKEQLKIAIDQADGIVHLAAVSRVIWGEQDPEFCWKTNYEATCDIINLSLKSKKQPWIIYASSREVYGTPEIFPVTEQAPYNPINIYGRSKVESEKAILIARDKGLNTVIVRYSNVYGSINDHPDRVIPAFCRAAAFGTSMRVDGSHNTFDFTYIDDVVDGTLKVIALLHQKHQNLPPFHFTNGDETSLQEAAAFANEIGGNQCEIIEALPRSYDVANFYGDSIMTRRFLNWQPQTNVKLGMSRLIKAFQSQMDEV